MDTYLGRRREGHRRSWCPTRRWAPWWPKKAKDAGIPLIAVDDDITYKDGSPVPYVGMNAQTIGRQVGAEIARHVKATGWDKDWSTVRVGSVEDQKADTCMRRNRGAEEAFLAAFPDFPKENIVRIPYDNTMVNAIDVVGTTLTANPAVERWMFFSCNDDGVLGSVRATENAGMRPTERDRRRHRRLALVRGLRRRQAQRLQRHDVARLGEPRRHRDRSPPRQHRRRQAVADGHLHAGDLINADNFADYKAKLGCK